MNLFMIHINSYKLQIINPMISLYTYTPILTMSGYLYTLYNNTLITLYIIPIYPYPLAVCQLQQVSQTTGYQTLGRHPFVGHQFFFVSYIMFLSPTFIFIYYLLLLFQNIMKKYSQKGQKSHELKTQFISFSVIS